MLISGMGNQLTHCQKVSQAVESSLADDKIISRRWRQSLSKDAQDAQDRQLAGKRIFRVRSDIRVDHRAATHRNRRISFFHHDAPWHWEPLVLPADVLITVRVLISNLYCFIKNVYQSSCLWYTVSGRVV